MSKIHGTSLTASSPAAQEELRTMRKLHAALISVMPDLTLDESRWLLRNMSFMAAALRDAFRPGGGSVLDGRIFQILCEGKPLEELFNPVACAWIAQSNRIPQEALVRIQKIQKHAGESRTVELLQLDHDQITIDQVMAELARRQDLERPTIEHLLCFVVSHVEVLRSEVKQMEFDRIVFLHEPVQNAEGKLVMLGTPSIIGGVIGEYPIDNKYFSSDYRFAAVRRIASPNKQTKPKTYSNAVTP